MKWPAGLDYGLVVRCGSCVGTMKRASIGAAGFMGVVRIIRKNTFGDTSITLVIEVYYRSGSSCTPRTLTVMGNSGAGASSLSCG